MISFFSLELVTRFVYENEQEKKNHLLTTELNNSAKENNVNKIISNEGIDEQIIVNFLHINEFQIQIVYVCHIFKKSK